MTKKEFKVGDKVASVLYTSTGKKKTVKGKVKEVKKYYGVNTYTITGGIVEDFPSRTITK